MRGRGLSRHFQRRQSLLARDRWIVFQELRQTFSRLEAVEQIFQWDPRAHKHGNPTLDFRVAMYYDWVHDICLHHRMGFHAPAFLAHPDRLRHPELWDEILSSTLAMKAGSRFFPERAQWHGVQPVAEARAGLAVIEHHATGKALTRRQPEFAQASMVLPLWRGPWMSTTGVSDRASRKRGAR